MTIDVIAAARRRIRRLVIAALVGIVVVAACVYPAGLYVNAHLEDGQRATPAATVGPSAGLEVADALLPADVASTRLAGVALPTSPETGPARTVGALAGGFAQSRAGAVVAALHLLVRTAPQVGPAVFEPTIAEQVTGEHATAMGSVVADLYRRGAARAGLSYGQPLGDLPARVVGIRIDAYTEAEAHLSVLTAAPDATGVSRYAATAVTLVWSDGDWRLLAPPGGSWDDLVRIVDPAQAAGYTPITGR